MKTSVQLLLLLLLLGFGSATPLPGQESNSGKEEDSGDILPLRTEAPVLPLAEGLATGDRDIDHYEYYVWNSPVWRRGDTNRQDFSIPLRLSDGTEVRGLGQIFNPFYLYDFYSDFYTATSGILPNDPGETDADYIGGYLEPIFYSVDSLFISPYKYILSDPVHSAYVSVFGTTYNFNTEEYKTKGFVEERGKLTLLEELEMTPEMLDRTIGESTQADSFKIVTTRMVFDPPLELDRKESLVILYSNDDAPALPFSSLNNFSEAQYVVGFAEYGKGEPEYFSTPLDTFRCFGVVMERKHGIDSIASLWKKRIALANGKIISSNGTILISVFGQAGFASGLRYYFGGTTKEEGIRTLYPNPASANARVEFSLGRAAQVRLELFSAEGREVRTLERGRLPEGNYSMEIDLSDLAPGSYLVRLTAGEKVFVEKMMVAER